MLATLDAKKRDIDNQLGRMPIANITMMHEKRIKELEDDLQNTENAIKTFSQSKVYIALD